MEREPCFNQHNSSVLFLLISLVFEKSAVTCRSSSGDDTFQQMFEMESMDCGIYVEVCVNEYVWTLQLNLQQGPRCQNKIIVLDEECYCHSYLELDPWQCLYEVCLLSRMTSLCCALIILELFASHIFPVRWTVLLSLCSLSSRSVGAYMHTNVYTEMLMFCFDSLQISIHVLFAFSCETSGGLNTCVFWKRFCWWFSFQILEQSSSGLGPASVCSVRGSQVQIWLNISRF